MKKNSLQNSEANISLEMVDLNNTEKELLNTLDDSSEEKYNSEDTQKALLNILDDYGIEKINMGIRSVPFSISLRTMEKKNYI